MIKLIKSNLLAIAFICLFISCSTDEIDLLAEPNYEIDLSLSLETDWQTADEILMFINEYRNAQGLLKIEKDQQYASAYAVEHTKYMIENEVINHNNFYIRSEALKERGAEYVGEIVARGYLTAGKVVTAWVNSPSHREQIEGPYSYVGFGVIKNPDGNYFFTLLFYT